MSDLRLAQKTEASVTEQARDSLAKQLNENVYSKDNAAVLSAAIASTDKNSPAVLPKLTVEEQPPRVVGMPTYTPQYFHPVAEMTAKRCCSAPSSLAPCSPMRQ